jgi:NTP pyrophosphatase (non-canonical NTP hydrolase)
MNDPHPTPMRPGELSQLAEAVRVFSEERDWAKFHDPKSLALAVASEAGQLAELFRWIPESEATADFSHGERQLRAGEEIADALIFLVRLADVLGIDLPHAVNTNFAATIAHFPTNRVTGKAPNSA